MSKKTNIEHLRELVKDNDEANEFLDAIEEQFDASNTILKDAEDEISSLEEDVSNLKTELREAEEEPALKIDAGIGVINWNSDNIRLMSLMETLGEKIKQHGDVRVQNLLNAL